MLKKLLLVTVSVAGLAVVGPITVAYADNSGTVMTGADQAALDAQVAAVEALVTQYQNDPDGLQAAIENLVVGATDPETTGNAVLIVFDNSQNPAIRAILANNAGLAGAGGRGLGAAIATLGVTDPDLAARMAANVSTKGGTSFVASVQQGSDTRTASIQQKNNSDTNANGTQNSSSTPETPASAS